MVNVLIQQNKSQLPVNGNVLIQQDKNQLPVNG